MTETPRARATVTFQDLEVTATKDRLWHVEAAGRAASASSSEIPAVSPNPVFTGPGHSVDATTPVPFNS